MHRLAYHSRCIYRQVLNSSNSRSGYVDSSRIIAGAQVHRRHAHALGEAHNQQGSVRPDDIAVESVEEEQGATSSPEQHSGLRPTKIDLHLASLRTAGIEPTLEDIEGCKPARIPSPDSKNYAAHYNALVERLCRTFSKQQLREFIKLYKLDSIWSRSGRRKTEYAESIMEKVWGWRNLRELERNLRDKTEIISRTFPVTASELFLLLGTDGSDLLRLSTDYNVHVAVVPNPLALKIEGLRGSIKQLEILIAEKRKEIVEETFELQTGAPISQVLLQHISRVAGALVENVGQKGKIKISARNASQLEAARRLTIRTATFDAHSSRIPFLIHVPPESSSSFPSSYALYPFHAPHGTSPQMTDSMYRARRVGEWLGNPIGETAGDLSDDQSILLHVLPGATNFKDLLIGSLGDLSPPEASYTVTATLGHVLFTTRTSSPENKQLLGPFPGQWPIVQFMQWVEMTKAAKKFISSLPAPLQRKSGSPQKRLHQLIYQCISEPVTSEQTMQHDPIKLIKFMVNINDYPTPNPQTESWALSDLEEAVSVSNTDTVIPVNDNNHNQEQFTGPPSMSDFDGEPICQIGTYNEFHLALPDRPVDLKLEVEHGTEIPVQWNEISSYFIELRASLKDAEAPQPKPPLQLTYGSNSYTLRSSAFIRRSMEWIKNTSITADSVLDLETNHQTVSCEVTCNEVDFESFKKFLQDCDILTSFSYSLSGDNLKTPIKFDHDDDSL